MSTAIAMAPSPAPHERPSLSDLAPTPTKAPAVVAPLSSAVTAHGSVSPSAPKTATPSQRTSSSSPKNTPGLTVTSPHTSTRLPNGPPKIVVKKEPGSPSMPISRPRPSRLDLSKNKNVSNAGNPASARPMTAREPLGIQEMGIHCLSPGFVTDDPHMKDHIQRSMSVREQQRHIIEARLHQQSSKGDSSADRDTSSFAAKTPGMSRRNKAPPGLSIVAPSHKQFANERVIQSAPLGQSFTGRNNPAPYSRHLANQPSALSSTSHIHHVPANQTDNRLPPISDVFGQGLSGHNDNTPASLYPNSARAPPASPGPPPPPGPPSSRPREYKSAEEAQHELAGGRPELLPKLVHYGGHQPPTPPSPAPGSRIAEASRSASKRRTRAEYEEGGSPPLGYGPSSARRGPFGAGRDSPETQRQKREEFLKLCERAWDLFHS
ncbi:hypothetical protein V2G26_013907 [Clonostachys chloroleuca]